MQMSYYLFLDDERIPAIAANHVYPVELRFLYRKEKWVLARDYRQFIDQILWHGLPTCISFDYDLGPEGTKTGYDCAVWLVDYCNKHSLELPQTLCHSLNPEGKEMILELFRYIR